MKYKLKDIKTVKKSILFSGIAIVFFSVQMIYRTTCGSPKNIKQSESYEKIQISPHTFIVNSVQQDSLKQWKIKSEMVFDSRFTDVDLNARSKSIDLYDSQYYFVPWFFTLYYLTLTILIILLFYHLYKFANNYNQDNPFNDNILQLGFVGNYLMFISFIYFFGDMMLIELPLAFNYNIYYISDRLSYQSLLFVFFVGFTGMLVQLFTRMALKGKVIQTEQDLTI